MMSATRMTSWVWIHQQRQCFPLSMTGWSEQIYLEKIIINVEITVNRCEQKISTDCNNVTITVVNY